jgi:hypothetical protein
MIDFKLSDVDSTADKISLILSEAWEIIYSRWPGAFNVSNEISNENRYDSEYYIQKTTGVNALHLILEVSIKQTTNTDEALNNFKNILSQSYVESSDWKFKAKFSGLTSKSGFNKVVQIILNEDLDV